MPSSCPPKRRCGTHAPGWLNGSHPSVADGAVQRQVCYHWSSGCCQWQNDIQVRNCGGFYVYKLKPTRFCSLRYCGNRGGKYLNFANCPYFHRAGILFCYIVRMDVNPFTLSALHCASLLRRIFSMIRACNA